MRVGLNPNKNKVIEDSGYFHQIIIPVYIPHFNDYYRDNFSILKLCLESLFKTTHKKTHISIVNNGSCEEVVIFLNNLYQEKKIHTLINTENIGKVNAIFKGLVGTTFELVTISDADVLFLNNWQDETYKVFLGFPKAGTVCPTPSSKSFSYLTANILRTHLFSHKLKFDSVKDPEALKSFALSVGNKGFYNQYHLSKILSVSNGKISAIVGAGHFVATYRGVIFQDFSFKFSKFKMGNSLTNSIDIQTVKKGFWRLSTLNNFAYHMGNTEEPWMREEVKNLKDNNDDVQNGLFYQDFSKSLFSKMLDRVFNYLFQNPFFRRHYLKYKGLTSEEADNY